MNTKIKVVIESYVRAFVVALGVAYSDGFTGAEEILIAALIAVVGPAIRAINPKDPAFGVMADVVTAELDKLAKASKKKPAPKKKTK
jgi:predicted RNA polymerase sigma factor